jgi:hypothetical protein
MPRILGNIFFWARQFAIKPHAGAVMPAIGIVHPNGVSTIAD